VAVTISDFVISGIYNGQNIGLASCDADMDPFNGCFDTSVFDTPTADCAGIPAGDSALDDCGVCDGGNASMDDCGVCNGDGSSCVPGVYGLALNAEGNLDVTFDSPVNIYGFEFSITLESLGGVTVTGLSGGAAAEANYTTTTGNNIVIGFSVVVV
jgi:hypothetical protein